MTCACSRFLTALSLKVELQKTTHASDVCNMIHFTYRQIGIGLPHVRLLALLFHGLAVLGRNPRSPQNAVTVLVGTPESCLACADGCDHLIN